MIEITQDLLPDFKNFMNQDGLEFNVTPDKDLVIVEELINMQIFKMHRDIWESVCMYKGRYYDPIIFGKDCTENVVNIDVRDDGQVILYKEVNGRLELEIREFRPWILTNRAITEDSQKLEGYQYYKWITEFESVDAWQKAKNILRKKHHSDGFMYVANDLKENFMMRHGVTYFKNMKPREISILSFDIESNGLTMNEDSKTFLISNTYRCGDKVVKKLFDIFDYNCNDQDMIDAWCSWVNEVNPTFLLGHNILMYDLKWLDHCSRAGLKIGRDGSKLDFASYSSQFRKDGSQSYEYNKAILNGREVLDTFFISIKYDVGRKYSSYGLKSIIKEEGLEKQGRSFVDASKIKEVYYRIIASNFKDQEALQEWTKVRDYAVDDSDDSLKLFDLMCPALFYFTQTVPKSFQAMTESATGSQMNSIMVRSYLQDNKSVAKASEAAPFEGAISLGVPGVYSNCLKWDVSSLYPSIMREYKVYEKSKDPDKNFLHITEYYAVERLKNKKLAKETGDKYYKDLEQTQKIGANSLYGFLGATGLNYNFPAGASLITRKGREILEKAILWATGKNSSYWKEFHSEGEESDES